MGPQVEVEAADEHRREDGHRPVEAGAGLTFGRTGFRDGPSRRGLWGHRACSVGQHDGTGSTAPLYRLRAPRARKVARRQRDVTTRLKTVQAARTASASTARSTTRTQR